MQKEEGCAQGQHPSHVKRHTATNNNLGYYKKKLTLDGVAFKPESSSTAIKGDNNETTKPHYNVNVVKLKKHSLHGEITEY